MPSIEQCETASASMTALPSTLEFFDKFKVLSSVSENGKDSDSEESFHLPLDDDDMESPSIISNGREIYNEETEDDILNKFETVPTGTPDHIDSHIEDTILDDDNLTEKEISSLYLKSAKEALKSSDNSDTSTPYIEEISKSETNGTKIEIKLTYGFDDDYEDSGDGEFKSIYETEDLATESNTEEAQKESTESVEITDLAKLTKPVVTLETSDLNETTIPIETVEPMEIVEEPEIIDCTGEEIDEPQPPQKDLQKVVSGLDNFEDSMEVEQEDTNQDIANIIEKLENPDTPMADVDILGLNDEGDINMVENCDNKALAGDNAINSEKITEEDVAEKEAMLIKDSEDVEMTGDCQINKAPQDSKENVDQLVINKSSEVTATFQEPLEVPTDSKEACSSETQEQINIDEKKKVAYNNAEKDFENRSEPEENVKIVTGDKKSEISDRINEDIIKGNETVRTEDQIKSNTIDTITSSIETEEDLSKEKSSKIVEQLPSEISSDLVSNEIMSTEECASDESLEMDKLEIVDELKPLDGNKHTSTSVIDELQDDDLLKELDKTINESETDLEVEALTKINNVQNADIEASNEIEKEKESEKDDEQPASVSSKEEDVFKAPVDVLKDHIEVLTQNEEKDIHKEVLNDKTDEDELDLLDISMVRETDEDDACAIADALIDKDAQISEKSDEEQSEKVETEQEGSDIDKDNDHDNEGMDPMDFDDTDDESHVEAAENDDSSNAESTKDRDKVVNISESSKDSMSESEPKRPKTTAVDAFIESSNDCMAVEVSASESGEEQEKIEVSDSLVPDTSLNLESTLVQDEPVASVIEEEKSVSPAPSIDEIKKKDEESKTDTSTEKPKESPQMVEKEPIDDAMPEVLKPTENTERKKSQFNKRTLSTSDIENAEVSAKKPKLATMVEAQKEPVDKTPVSSKKPAEKDTAIDITTVNEKVKTLTGFSKFMQCRQFTAKLSRSDLEQFCIQKICESLMLKSSEGDLHQSIKKHEKTIDVLRKDMQQLSKQCKDLEIVNKKLMNELRNQNTMKKPLVPLKITRSVGLQVRLNPGNETPNQNRRKQGNTNTTPQKQIIGGTNTTVNRLKVTTGSVQQPTVVRQVLQSSPQKSPLTAGQTTVNNATPTNPLLAQALQPQKPRQTGVAAKRTTAPIRKTPEVPKPPTGSGVIDLTEEDDRLAGTKSIMGNTLKIINKTVTTTPNKTLTNKIVTGKTMTNQGKQVQKTVTVGPNKGNTLSQGIRLTPASVITSSANGSPQMVYVVPTITSNAGGTQKVAFVNFQPTNGVLSGTLNGSTVSVMSNKGQTLTLKTVSTPRITKHPAALPPPPRIIIDPKLRPLLPKPHLTIKKIETGIILQWKMPYNLEQYESIASYQLYAYQETSSPPSTDMWRKVGDVKALALPMACTLTQFADKNKYYFAVRSVDVHKRIGAFSDPEEISL